MCRRKQSKIFRSVYSKLLTCTSVTLFLQKHIIFQLYIATISAHALFLTVNQFAHCIKHEWRNCSTYSPPATVILLLFLIFEALMFAIFTIIMCSTQLNAIFNDETVSLFFLLCFLMKEHKKWFISGNRTT